jgi:hypothetical protein
LKREETPFHAAFRCTAYVYARCCENPHGMIDPPLYKCVCKV